MVFQVKSFENLDDLNNFIRTMPEENIQKIDWNVIDGEVELTEIFMVVYKINL
jgi:hypothetical protein